MNLLKFKSFEILIFIILIIILMIIANNKIILKLLKS